MAMACPLALVVILGSSANSNGPRTASGWFVRPAKGRGSQAGAGQQGRHGKLNIHNSPDGEACRGGCASCAVIEVELRRRTVGHLSLFSFGAGDAIACFDSPSTIDFVLGQL